MTRLCVIPARGGSKRIPKKNIKPFLGKPIIIYTIDTAIKSNLFDEIMVSTDDPEIAEIAKKHGAKVPFFRSVKNANDFATTVDVLKEVIGQYKEENNMKFDTVCCIYPTAPFINDIILKEGLNIMTINNFDSVFPVIPFSFPIQRAVRVDSNNRIELFQPAHKNTRSQDLETFYHDTGQFYWFKPEVLFNQNSIWTNNTGVLIVKETEAQDIDTLEDWKLAEIKYKLLNEKKTTL